MRNQTTLKNPETQHVVNYDDVLLIKSCGVSLSAIAAVIGYSSPSVIYERLKPYRCNGKYFPPSVSCILETALWRLGCMSRYIAAKQRLGGADSVNWDKLPDHLKTWQ